MPSNKNWRKGKLCIIGWECRLFKNKSYSVYLKFTSDTHINNEMLKA